MLTGITTNTYMSDDGFVAYVSDDDFFSDDFDKFGKEKTVLASAAMTKIYADLYRENSPQGNIDITCDKHDDSAFYGNYRCGGQEGYSAHNDSVDDKEIQTWKSSFPYLKIEGTRILPIGQEVARSGKDDEYDCDCDSYDFVTQTYRLHVSEPWFSLIGRGEKSIEGRLKKNFFESMQVGEMIEFYNENQEGVIAKKIAKLSGHSSFEEMMNTVGVEKILPGIEAVSRGIMVYRKFYSEDNEKSFGVIGIHLE